MNMTAMGRSLLAGAAILAALGFNAAGRSAVAEPVPQKGPLAVNAAIDRPLVLKGDRQPVYVLVNLEARAPDAGRDLKRPPLNLSLVLDRSGSMQDAGKLDYLKAAASRIVDQLGPADVLSIVDYDDRVSVLWPAGPVGSASLVKGLIEKLEPRGSTDLAGGMMAGVAEAARARSSGIAARGAVSRVLLLSDGLANHGITDPSRIRELARGARADGVTISALGLGRDYDEDLMQAIAEHGGGRYHYVESPAQTSRIFALEMNTLFHLAAQDIRLEAEAAPGAGKALVLGFDGPAAEIGAMAGGERRALLVRFEPDTQSPGMRALGALNVSYVDPKFHKRHNFEVSLGIEVTEDEGAVAQARNAEVAVEAVMAETERGQKEAVKRLQAGDHAGAQSQMSQLVQAVEKSQAQLKDKRLEKKLEALSIEQKDMAEAALAPAQGSEYLKRTKQRLYQAKTGQRALSLLREGDRGYEVERLQEALIKAGYYRGPVDGIFSASVTQAVKAFQKAEMIGSDGVAGPSTMKELGLY